VDTYRLKYFLRVAEEGSINRAASVLGVAQPALSRQIRLLEEQLGVTLFRRTARGVELTEEGEQLRATTSAPLRQLELAMRYAGSPLARLERGLHLGLPPTAAGVLGVPLLDSLSAAFPKVSFHLAVASSDDLVEGMLKGAVDIAVINPVPGGKLFQEELLVEDLVVVGGPTADLEPTRPVEFTELANRPLVLPDSPTGIRTTLENAALRLKVRLLCTFATDSLHVAKDLIAAGHGYGVLPMSACAADIEAQRLRYAPLGEPAPTHQLATAVTSNLDLPRGFARRVGEVIRDEAVQLVRSGVWSARLSSPMQGE
jgi:LysR family nitrogen assimilation transcriptional regulator